MNNRGELTTLEVRDTDGGEPQVLVNFQNNNSSVPNVS